MPFDFERWTRDLLAGSGHPGQAELDPAPLLEDWIGSARISKAEYVIHGRVDGDAREATDVLYVDPRLRWMMTSRGFWRLGERRRCD